MNYIRKIIISICIMSILITNGVGHAGLTILAMTTLTSEEYNTGIETATEESLIMNSDRLDENSDSNKVEQSGDKDLNDSDQVAPVEEEESPIIENDSIDDSGEIIQVEGENTSDEDNVIVEYEDNEQELTKKTVKPDLIQLFQYPSCKDALHLIYDKPNGKKIDYVSAHSIDDVLYLDETDKYFKIYYSGNVGWVEKNTNKTCSATGETVLLTAEPRLVTVTRATDDTNNEMIVNPFEISDNLKTQVLEESIIMNNQKAGLQYQEMKPANSPSYYKRVGDRLYHCYTSDVKKVNATRTCTTIGRAPSYLKTGEIYYSYDGNYFFTDLTKVTIDGENAVNSTTPYYNYYQYLPMRSKTNITEKEFNSYLSKIGYTSSIIQEDKDKLGIEKSWDENGKLTEVDWKCNYTTFGRKWIDSSGSLCMSQNKSMLFGGYNQLKETEDYKGVNALFEAVWAIHESAYGTSPISIFKNNLYGMGATDSNTFQNANQYSSISEGANDHVDSFVNKYLYQQDYRYFGPHLGNKGSGINRWYASDPFWGEKIAGQYYMVDEFVGFKDYNYYSIGIIQNNIDAKLKKSPNASSKILYPIQNNNYGIWIDDYPVLITGESNGHYQVKTDSPIVNDTPQKGGKYDWYNTYGYIEKKLVSLLNHSSYKIPGTGWEYKSGNWYYINDNGTKATGWKKVNGKWYYLESNGARATGWKKVNDKWYYLESNGVMATGWKKVNSKWYYLESNGARATGWKKVNGSWYYLESNGARATGWKKVNSKWYYLESNGKMATGWKKVNGKWYYLESNGKMATGWKKVNGKWYYLESNGKMATGWKKVNGSWYYLESSGAMATGWKIVNGSWYYLESSGAMATGWKIVNGSWYYLESSGAMATGWKKINGSWYYLESSGAMATGWKKINGSWYYLESSGAMATGWKKINGSWYYLYSSGKMAVNTTIDGWKITSNGKAYKL